MTESPSTPPSPVDISQVYALLVAKARADADFRALLKSDPVAALADCGITLPPDVTLHVIENSPTQRTIVLPPRPTLPPAARWTADASNPYGTLVGRAWSDRAFKQRLLSDPRSAMRECGMEVAPEVHLEVVERTADTAYLILPPETT